MTREQKMETSDEEAEDEWRQLTLTHWCWPPLWRESDSNHNANLPHPAEDEALLQQRGKQDSMGLYQPLAISQSIKQSVDQSIGPSIHPSIHPSVRSVS